MLNEVKIIKKEVKNITLKVRPNGEVILTAPKAASDEHIKFIIKKRAKWIVQKRAFFSRLRRVKKNM